MSDVNLVSYLPPFMTEFKELTAALDAENPEFILLWVAIDRVFQNTFSETADEYGLSRLEGVLGILPTPADTLESRRQRLRGSYTSDLPYTCLLYTSHHMDSAGCNGACSAVFCRRCSSQ